MKDNNKGGNRGGYESGGRGGRPFRGKSGGKSWGKPGGRKFSRPDGARPDRGDGEQKPWQKKKEWPRKNFKNRDWKNKDGDRSARDFGRDDKPRRFDRDNRRDEKRDDRKRDDRPRRFDREDRPRRFDRDDRPKRFDRDDRPKRFDRNDRPGKFDRPERPDPDSYAARKSRENRGERLVKERPKRETLPSPNLYGFHAVSAAWLNPKRAVKSLYLTENGARGFEPIMAQAKAEGLERPVPLQVERDVLDRMLPRDTVHQGVGAIAQPLEEVFVQDFIVAAQGREKAVLVMLDQVTDPHNVGAVIRSACAFGACGLVMQRMHAPEMEGALAKAASGAIEHLPVAYETNLSRAIEELKEGGFFVCGLAEEGEDELGKIAARAGGKIVLVMGSEGAGLRRLVREHCDALARLPVSGPVKSLNVSNAAAVSLYAATRA